MTAALPPRGAVRTPVLFLLAVAALPFMDWPYMLGFSSYVRPLALGPIVLGLIAMASHMLTTGRARVRISGPLVCFALFVACALVVTPIAILADPGAETVKGTTVYARSVRELFGLLVGLGCFAFFTQNIRSTRDVRAAVRTLYLVFPLTVLAVLIQAGWLYFGSDALFAVDRHVLGLVQAHPAIAKASGLTPEGSMLADQLLSVVIPFALAGLALRHSVFRVRLLGSSVELWMLLGAVVALLFTLSRLGLMVFVVLFLAMWFYRVPVIRQARRKPRYLVLVPVLLGILLVSVPSTRAKLIEVTVSIRGVTASANSGIWSNVTRLGTQIAGYRMFLDNPMGVGTGGYAFHFARYVPSWALLSPEIQAFLGWTTPAAGYCGTECDRLLADPKGFGARIAAENGVVGLLLIGTMFVLLVRRSWHAYRHGVDPTLRYLGLGCLLSLSAIFPLSFNQSSYIWVHWYLIFAMAGALPPYRTAAVPGPRHAARVVPAPEAPSG